MTTTTRPPRLTGLRRLEAQLLAARKHLACAARTAREELPGLDVDEDVEDALAHVRSAEQTIAGHLEEHPKVVSA